MRKVRRSAFRDAPTTVPETSTSPGSHICQASPNSSFPCFPSPSSVSVPPNGEQREQQLGCGEAGLRGANAAPGPHSPRRAQITASALRPPAGGRTGQRPAPWTAAATAPSSVARRLPTGGGRRARRMRAALPGVPATLPPPTARACHFLPSPHLRPGSVSRSLSLPESLSFPLPTRSAAVAQALRGRGDREREGRT